MSALVNPRISMSSLFDQRRTSLSYTVSVFGVHSAFSGAIHSLLIISCSVSLMSALQRRHWLVRMPILQPKLHN